jgi:lipoate-protein ligase A
LSIKPLSAVQFLDMSFVSPAEQLACDEALLLEQEERGGPPSLWFWEPRQVFVVLGYTNAAAREVHLDACHARAIPLYRRYSGGGAVVQAPGCLNFSLVLPLDADPALKTAGETSAFVMGRHASALQPLLKERVEVSGFSDLTIGGRKFAGSAQRRLHRSVLLHGSLLLACDLSLIDELLPMPSRQPGYRAGRSHAEFLRTLDLPVAAVQGALRAAWGAREARPDAPLDEIRRLARERYADPAWTLKEKAPAPHGG